MEVIVTGGNSGVGEATAAALTAAGHSVVIACRTVAKAERAAAAMAGDVTVLFDDVPGIDLFICTMGGVPMEFMGNYDADSRPPATVADDNQ